MATGQIIDGVFASQAIDSSGEVLDIEGCDISTLDKDGVLNYEHKEGDKKDSKGGNNGEEIVGKIIYAHKILKESDCETSRQKEYWNKIGHIPFIYGMCRLYDGAGHSGAQALAAQIRDHHANGDQILVRFSIEGSTLEREGNRLKESVARRVAATLKPCNRTAVSGLIEDPRAPEGFEKKPVSQEKPVKDILSGLFDDNRDDEDTKKRERDFQHPMYTKLGGEVEVECIPLIKGEDDLKKALKLIVKAKMIKAMAAGNMNAAPSTLTGGAALQREHIIGVKNKALAIWRDHGKRKFDKTEFKKILKNKLPEADDSFIDHFANIAEDYHVKLKKAEDLIKKEQTEKKVKAKAPKVEKPKAQKPAKVKLPSVKAVASSDDEGDEGGGPFQMTYRGQPVKPTTATSPLFDEKTGILHVPPTGNHSGGQFPMYIPSKDTEANKNSFHNIMNDPKVNEFHDYAMHNWSKVNHLLKQGKLPPEVVMHGVLFSQLSPNTPVPMQELMYGHLVDSMKHKGIDARDPAFAGIKDDWMSRDRPDKLPDKLPDNSPEHWERLKNQIRLKNDSKGSGRKVGDLASFMLANNKFDNMEKYHKLHDQMVDLVSRHRDDSRSAVRELMHHKDQAGLHDSRRKAAMKAGKPDIGPYTAGPAVNGLAPKTARYTYGMLGGGNSMVPDTHFARYLFGLEKGKDNRTIGALKDMMWNEKNTPVLEGIDRYYGQHHDAVAHMQQHPQYKHLFADNPERAIFPAFWKNWVGIAPHERARGYNTGAFNEHTDHRPFWETIDPFLGKSEEDHDTSLPARTATIHNQWVKQFGEMPAMMMYYRHLVPRLLAAHEKRTVQHTIRKMEAMTIDIRKTTAEIAQGDKEESPSMFFAGHHVQPGKAKTAKGDYTLLHEDATHYVGVPSEHAKFFQPEHLVKLPKNKENTHFHVHSRPTVLVSDLDK